MLRLTFGPQIQYVLSLTFFILTISTWIGGNLNAQELSIKVDSKDNASCPDASDGSISVSIEGGTSPYTYNWSGPGSYSETGVTGITGLRAGTYTFSVSDSSEPNQQSKTLDISIEDTENIAPTVNAPANKTGNTSDDGSGNCTTTLTTGTADADDNCEIQSLKAFVNSNEIDPETYQFPIGNTSVTWTATDRSGNTASDTQTISIIDNEAPTITAPSNKTINTDTGQCTASNVSLGTPTSTDNCGVKNVTNDAPTTFPLGKTIVTWTVIDDSNNSQTATQEITVEDNEIPVITVDSNIDSTNETGTCQASLSIAPPTVTDNCGTNAPVGARDDNKGINDPYPVGTTTITWDVEDVNGNIGNSVIQEVTIKDNEAPVPPVLEKITWGCEYTVTIPEAADNCDGNIIATGDRSTTFTSSGDITWSFKDSNGNISTIVQNVTINQIQLSVDVENIKCNGFSTGEATAVVEGGIGPFTYDWGSLGTGATKTELNSGDYTLTVTDVNGCQVTNEVVITEPGALSISGTKSTSVTCNGGSDGKIEVGEVEGGVPPFEYSINNNNYQDSTVFDNLPSDSYTIFIRDANDCALQDFVSVEQPDELNAYISKVNINCNGDNTGEILFSNITGGSESYEFKIDGPDSRDWIETTKFSDLIAGDYSISIRDLNNTSCIINLNPNFTLSEPAAELSATYTATRTSRFGAPTGSATVNATGGTSGYFYEWRKVGDDTFIQNTQTATDLMAGNYTVMVRDSKGCELSEPLPVEIIDNVDAQIIKTTRCLDSDDNLRTSTFQVDVDLIQGGVGDPTTDFQYKWEFGQNAQPANSGEYSNNYQEIHTVTYSSKGDKVITLWVKDGSGFESSYTFDQYVGECFSGCVGGSSQDFTIDEDNYFIGDKDGNKLTNLNCLLATEKYLYIDITKASNAHTLDVEMIYNTRLNGITVTSGRLIQCFGTVIGTKGNKDIYSKIDTGIYPLFEVKSIGDPDEDLIWSCGQDIIIDQIRIKWTVNDNKVCGDTNRNSCIDSKDVTTAITPVLADVFPTNIKCNGSSTGALTFLASGGTKPYRYSITGDIDDAYQPSKEFFGLPAGEYSDLWVKDATGKSYRVIDEDGQNLVVTITQPTLGLEIKSIDFDEIDCNGGSTILTVNVEGGTAPYNYVWNDLSIENNNTNEATVKGGEYSVTVTDANGCQTIKNVTIVEPPVLSTPNAGEDQNLNCGVSETTLNANTITDGVGTWSIDTNNSDTGGTITDPSDPNSTFSGAAGIYTLNWTITNENGECSDSDSVIINFSEDCINLDFDGVDDYIGMTNNYGFTSGNFTIELWVKPENTTGLKTILSKKDKAANSGGYDLILNGGSPTFRWGSKSATTSRKLTSARWHHIAVVFKQNSARLFVDGIDVGNADGSNPAVTTAPFLLGAIYDSGTPNNPKDHYPGWMEELRIWKTALTKKDIRFMMNQRLQIPDNISSTSIVEGKEIPNKSTTESYYTANGFNLDEDGDPFYNLTWGNLAGYYPLISINPDPLNIIDIDENLKPSNGSTPDLAIESTPGRLYNIDTNQNNTAPLPYISNQDGEWSLKTTWLRPSVWESPNSKGIDNATPIDWNIARIQNDISSGKDIKLLGLSSESGELEMNGTIKMTGDQSGTGTGNGLTISHYLKLDGSIDLNGESQLVQPQGSILDSNSSGSIDIDQQGTANSFNYNYWTSPVSLTGGDNNSGFKIKEVLLDATNLESSKALRFNYQYHWADNYDSSQERRISSYWFNTFQGTADDYFQWAQVAETDLLLPGIGYTMKGTMGYVSISDRQNYTFRGKPNNGDISVDVAPNQNLLTGNPYPSAIDAYQFIDDNAIIQENFNGSIYFWDHFGKEDSHYLEEYVGGYAVMNKSGGVTSASSIDSRINDNNSKGNAIPGQFIPVGQAFFINTVGASNPQSITFKNEYRAFVPESTGDSYFHSQEDKDTKKSPWNYKKDTRYKIRLKFESPTGFHRQILVTADGRSTQDVDLGFDALLIENNSEDMYWMINEQKFVIQGVPDFNLDQILPLGIQISEPGEFTIKIDTLENIRTDFKIYLKDLNTDEYFDISEKEYQVNTEETGVFNNRYALVFREPKIEKPEETDINETLFGLQYLKESDEISLYNPDLMKVDRVDLYSISGQRIKTYQEIPSEEFIFLSIGQKLSSAVYILKVHSETNIFTRKVIINN